MKTDNIRIKRKNSDFLLCGILYLLLILAGIFLIGLPFLPFAPSGGGSTIFLVILGILCIGVGSTLYGFLLYRGLCPQDALIITNKGLTNHLIGGKEGVYIEWVNVSSMKVFGLSKAPMLGLSLEDPDSYLATLPARFAREAAANMEVGLPVIAIAQKDIFLPIGELKNLFSRMIKGAISWETYSTQSKKTASAASASPAAAPSAPTTETPVQQPATEIPQAAPAAEQTDVRDVHFTPVKPAQPAPEAEQTRAKTEEQVQKLLQEEPTPAPTPTPEPAPEPAAEPPKSPDAPTPTHTDTQEEIILLDIDND